MQALVAELREKTAQAALGGPEAARKKYKSRDKLFVRERIDLLVDAGAPFLEFSPLAANGMYGGDVASAGIVTGIGPHQRAGMRHRGQRRDGEGRHVFSAHSKEASARAADRAGEPAAVRLSRRLGRRVSSHAGRGLSRSRTLRRHLQQPGQSFGGRHCADRVRDGLVHRGRRLHPGYVG